jgi:hypothetical protein
MFPEGEVCLVDMIIKRITLGAKTLVNDESIHEVDALQRLIDESWREYDSHRHKDLLVTPSIPILFFGDLQRYITSPIRVVTVGLNPSRAEFPDTNRFQRFPKAYNLDAMATDSTFHRQYIASLSDYFRTDPLMRWFSAYEHILNGMDTSYRDGAVNTALHTDICSPLATDPTWSRLNPGQRTALESRGTALWHRLITYFAPSVLLVSVAREKRNRITFQATTEWETMHMIPRDNPYHVQTRTVRVIAGKDTFVIFGAAANTPFGTVSNMDKRALGVRVKEYIGG